MSDESMRPQCARDFGQITATLADHSDELQQIRVSMWKELKATRADVRGIHVLIVGNGKPGLVGRLQALELSRQADRRQATTARLNRATVYVPIACAVIAAAAAVVSACLS